jgi:hypothetical protein
MEGGRWDLGVRGRVTFSVPENQHPGAGCADSWLVRDPPCSISSHRLCEFHGLMAVYERFMSGIFVAVLLHVFVHIMEH